MHDAVDLYTAASNNPDGFGFALRTDRGIIRGHSMDDAELIHRYMVVRAEYPNAWAMFHARLGTQGTKDEYNCHPFAVDGNPDVVLGHNGILDYYDKKRCDTRIFAEDILPAFGPDALDNPNIRKGLETVIGPGNKIAVLSTDPALREPMYLLNGGEGHWLDGAWWSNDSYCWSRPFGTARSLIVDPFEDDDACPLCGAIPSAYDRLHDMCESCGTCMKCGADLTVCDCGDTTWARQYMGLDDADGNALDAALAHDAQVTA